MRVECYWNLNKACFSIRALEGRHKGRVIGHADRVLIRDATFVVQAAGRAKVLATGQKNVHAFVRGTLEGAAYVTVIEGPMPWMRSDGAYARAATKYGRRAYYNPKTVSSFTDIAKGEPIETAPMTLLRKIAGKGEIWAFDPLDMTEGESRSATY